MMNKYNLSPMDAFNGIELGKTIPGGSKYGNGKNGFADITFTHGNTTEIWEVKSSGVEDAQAVAAGEVQGYIRAYNAANPGKHAIPGESLPAPVTVPLGAGDISVFSPQGLNGGPPDGAILYSSEEPAPRTQPQPQPQPATQPNYAPAVAGAAGVAAVGGTLWWLGKLAAPACGPAVVLCAIAF